jgi:predicted SnoaL-like aldol condensation-catalyzing enzyme
VTPHMPAPRMSARRILVAALATSALLGAVTVPAVASPSAGGHHAFGYVGDGARLDHQKGAVVGLLKGVFERGDAKVVDKYVRTDRYIQHNPTAPDGADALKNLAVGFHQQFPDAKYDVKRVISEGDLVLAHSNLVMTPGSRGMAVFDIFRFQGGKIVEHWDTGQNVPDTSANGNDMFSTVSRPQTGQPGPRWLTAYNKKLVTKAFDQLIVRKDLSALDKYWGTEYHQHNPNIADGVAGAREGLAGLVVAGGLLGDDVHAVEGVDDGDEAHQGGELVLVVVLGGVRPGLVGDATGRVGDAGALLGQFQGGALGVGEDLGLPPGRDQVEAHRGLPGVRGVLGVHVGAEAAAVDLAGAELHQLLRRGRQRRVRDALPAETMCFRTLARPGWRRGSSELPSARSAAR